VEKSKSTTTQGAKEGSAGKRGLVCMFCGEGFGYAGKTPDEATVKAAYGHEAECTRNPYKARIGDLQAALSSLTSVLQQMACCGFFQTREQQSEGWDQYIDTLELNMSKALEVQHGK